MGGSRNRTRRDPPVQASQDRPQLIRRFEQEGTAQPAAGPSGFSFADLPVPQPDRTTQVASQRQHAASAIQRMVLLLDENEDDYALVKVLLGMDESKLPAEIEEVNVYQDGPYIIPYNKISDQTWRNDVQDFKELLVADDETVYIVGHGRPDLVWTEAGHGGEIEDFNQMATWVKQILPNDWDGEIEFMTCRSSSDRPGDAENVVEQFAAAWGANPPNVTGKSGFAYGMGDGTMAVLKSEYQEIYGAEKASELRTDTKEYLKTTAGDVGWSELRKVIPGLAKSDVPGNIVEKFIETKLQIEADMKESVERNAGDDIYEKVQSMGTGFTRLIARQKALFEAFDLWA